MVGTVVLLKEDRYWAESAIYSETSCDPQETRWGSCMEAIRSGFMG